MDKDKFSEFISVLEKLDCKSIVSEYDIDIDNVILSVYLSCEENSYIEYGDFALDSYMPEFLELLKEDGYLYDDGTIADRVERILCWQVWLTVIQECEPIANIHIFDASNEGCIENREYVALGSSREE